jgi:hypothetical protein
VATTFPWHAFWYLLVDSERCYLGSMLSILKVCGHLLRWNRSSFFLTWQTCLLESYVIPLVFDASLGFFFFFFWDMFLLCSPVWPGTHCAVQADLKPMTLLPQPPGCWNYRCAPPHPVLIFIFLEVKGLAFHFGSLSVCVCVCVCVCV